MASEHSNIIIVSAEPSGDHLIVYFSDGTTTLFQSHFLYEVRSHDGNVALTNLSDDDLLKGFDDEERTS